MHPTLRPPTEGLPTEEGRTPTERFPPAGKPHQQMLTAANVCTTSSGHLFISDRTSKQRYLVDTRSDLCVFPRSSCQVAGSALITSCTLPMGPPSPHMDGPAEFEPGTAPRLRVAFRGGGRTGTNHWFGPTLTLRSPCRLQEQTPARQVHLSVNARLQRTIIRSQCEGHRRRHTPRQPHEGIHREVRHNTTHHIPTTPGPPVACRPRRLAADRLAVAKAEFDAMVRDGTARRAESPWSSVLHLVPKDSDWSPCGAYRSLNPLAHTDVRETAGLARSINTQTSVRWSEPSMSFAFCQ